jgi:hypothetical protein
MIYSTILFIAFLVLRILVAKQSHKFIYNDSSNLIFSSSLAMFVIFSITILNVFYGQENQHLSKIQGILNMISITSFALGSITLLLNLFMYATSKYPTFIVNKILRRLVKLALLLVSFSLAFIFIQYIYFFSKV